MKIDSNRLENLIRLIAKQELLPRFTKVTHSHKADGSIVTEADIETQNAIEKALSEEWPDIAFLGEEMTNQEQENILHSGKAVWCLDPLDGTSNFAGAIPYFAVSLSLINNGEVILGLVYDPIRDESFLAKYSNESELQCTLNGKTLTPGNTSTKLDKCIAIVDFKRLSNELATRLVCERPFSSQRNFGASALDWCWLAAGRGHVYLHGNQNLWDYAAGELIFTASGGKACTLEGESIYEKQIIKRSVVAAVNQDLFNEWRGWLGIND